MKKTPTQPKVKLGRAVHMIAGHDETSPTNRIRVWASNDVKSVYGMQTADEGLILRIPIGGFSRDDALAVFDTLRHWMKHYWKELTEKNPELISMYVYDVQNQIDEKEKNKPQPTEPTDGFFALPQDVQDAATAAVRHAAMISFLRADENYRRSFLSRKSDPELVKNAMWFCETTIEMLNATAKGGQ